MFRLQKAISQLFKVSKLFIQTLTKLKNTKKPKKGNKIVFENI